MMVDMTLRQPGGTRLGKAELLLALDDILEPSEAVAVLVDPTATEDAVSTTLVNRLKGQGAPIFNTWTTEEGYHDEDLHFDLCWKNARIHLSFTAWVERGDTLGAQLPAGIDVRLGISTIQAVQLVMRRAYLQEHSAGGFHPIFRGRGFTVDPAFCFVLMPFGEPWSDRIWRRHIKPTVESLGLRCERADDFFAPGAIVEDVWGAINRANLLIADLTGRNPNVFYELGIAHVVGVPTILLTQDRELVAFDTAHLRQIRYQDNTDGCETLESHLRAAISSALETMRFPR